MNNLRYPLGLAVVVIAVIAGIWIAARQPGAGLSNLRNGTAIGEVVPNIPFSTIDGDELATNDLRGKVVVVNAFATWCGPCRVETPELVKFYQANQDKVVLIGLNVGENEESVLGYQQDFGVPYPLVLDPGGKIAEQFRPRGLPTTWFIDPQGIVQAIHAGPLTAELMAQITAEIQ
jgi:thiol-disulfide isomerase/thioredoxin